MKIVHVSVCTEPGYDNHSNNGIAEVTVISAMDNNLHLLDLRAQVCHQVFCLRFYGPGRVIKGSPRPAPSISMQISLFHVLKLLHEIKIAFLI